MAELDVVMAGRRVGVLDDSGRQRLRFTYDEAWAGDPAATPLSVSMPTAARQHPGLIVEPYLWGLLPDNDRVLARWAADCQCSASDVMALLTHVGSDVAGAAQYLPLGTNPEEAEPGRIEPLTRTDVADLLRTVREDATAWHPSRHAGRWSLAGAQGKIALAHDDRDASWGVPSGSIPTTHILKPTIAGLDDHDLNEHLCLATARALDLHAAHTTVENFDGERALVVRRYDRQRRDGGIIRVHQEDFCQALGVHPTRKYENEGGPGIEQMIDLLRSTSSDDASRDIEALCRALAFNWLVLGTDAHAKNYSLLLSGRQVRLAPLYDIASALPYGDHPRKLRMAQKVGGEYRPTVIESRHWDRLARRAGIEPEGLHAEIRGMADQLPDAMSSAIAASALDRRETATASRLLDGITRWLAACRVNLTRPVS